MIDLAVFDMAGTTVDDRDEVYRVLRESVEREGADITDDQFQEWMGTEKRWAITNLLKIGGVEASEEMIDGAYEWFLETLAQSYRDNPPTVLPGVTEAITELRGRGIKIALTTGFSREIAEPLLESIGWTVAPDDAESMLDAVVTADTVAAGRPAPYMIHRAMEATGVFDVARVAAAGDTGVDVRAARNAGVLSIGVLTGHLTREDFAAEPHDVVVESVARLTEDPRFTKN